MEENNGEISSGKYFHLIGDLERGDRAVADSNKLKRILDDVKDGKFPAIRAENFATKARDQR